MRFRSCALASALLTAIAVQADSPASPAARQANAEAEVRALEQRWVDAELRRDAAAVAALLDDQFLSNQVVRVAGDTAIIIGRDTAEGTHHDGSHYMDIARYTATHIKRQARWRALAEHMVMEEPSHP